MIIWLSIFFGVCAWVTLFPVEAFAWGPITHMDYASEALKSMVGYAPAVKAVLVAHPKDFLYGSLAADITVGKSYVDYIYNCHNWRVGFLLLNEADDDRQRACAYGYLVHLAADIVAHNFFVPTTTIRSYPTRTLGHVYWEMRFDARRPKKIWRLTREICEMDFSHDDELFQRMLKRTLFSFKTNRRIFSNILNLHKLQRWQRGMRHLDRKSRWRLVPKEIVEYRQMALQSVKKFLRDPEKAPCTRVDPTGADKLLYAKEVRRQLQKAYRQKRISQEEADRFAVRTKRALKKGVYEDVELPEITDLFI